MREQVLASGEGQQTVTSTIINEHLWGGWDQSGGGVCPGPSKITATFRATLCENCLMTRRKDVPQ